MSLSSFINFSLVLTLFYTWVYYNASISLNDKIEEQVQIAELKNQIKTLQQKNYFLSYQIDDLSYQLSGNTFISSGRRPASINLEELSVQRLESAKALVRTGDLDKAFPALQEILVKFPLSPVLADVQLLMGDIQRARKKNVEAVAQYESLIELYPDRVQAGIALFRLGEIAEKNKNFQEAKAYYHIVQTQFSAVEELSQNARQKVASIEKKLTEIEGSGGL